MARTKDNVEKSIERAKKFISGKREDEKFDIFINRK